MSEPDRVPPERPPGAGRLRSVLGRLLLVAAALAITGLFLLAPADGGLTDSQGNAAALGRTPTPRATPASHTPRPSRVSTPRPTPPPDSRPGVPSSGGDQPSGPLPDGSGNIVENVNAPPDMLAIRDRLQQEIDGYSATVGGIEVAVAVTDLQTGQSISVNGNTLHKTGCTINAFALFAAVDRFQAGEASPDGLWYAINKGIGGSYPPEVRHFLDAVFGSYTAGVVRARELMAGWGMKASYFDHVPYYGGEEPPPNILTALELNAVFEKLYGGQLFNPEWTSYTMDVLTDIHSYVQYILPKYLPWQATVAHKIGYYWDYDGWVNNDAGIVMFTGSDGQQKAYAISYLSQGARTEYIGYSFGAKISRIVWDGMAPRYGVASPPWTPPQVVTPPPVYEEPSPDPTVPPETATPTFEPTPTATPEPPTATPTPPATPTPTLPPTPTRAPTPVPATGTPVH